MNPSWVRGMARVIERRLSKLSNNAKDYRYWWTWILVCRAKTVVTLYAAGSSWDASWQTGKALYGRISMLRLLCCDNPHWCRARRPGNGGSHPAAATQSGGGQVQSHRG